MPETVTHKIDQLSNTLQRKCHKLLADKVAENGGHLSEDDVNMLAKAFHHTVDAFKIQITEAVEAFAQERHCSKGYNQRTNSFIRLMVHNFEHQFANDHDLKAHSDCLSRRMLPGFINAVHAMVGTQNQIEYMEQSQAITAKVRTRGDGKVDWQDVYQTPGARMISLGAQIEIAQHFRQPDKRIDWLISMINSNMIPGDEAQGDVDWQFTRDAADRMLAAVFSDLRVALDNNATRQKIRATLGKDIVAVMDSVVGRFQ